MMILIKQVKIYPLLEINLFQLNFFNVYHQYQKYNFFNKLVLQKLMTLNLLIKLFPIHQVLVIYFNNSKNMLDMYDEYH